MWKFEAVQKSSVSATYLKEQSGDSSKHAPIHEEQLIMHKICTGTARSK